MKLMKSSKKTDSTTFLTTMTSEPHMLARINYNLINKEKIQQIFSKLKCMDYDSTHDRWVWLYDGEAKKIKFNVKYHQIPKEIRPIILGYFFSKSNETMYLDVDSFDRAKEAIEFFHKYIPVTVSKATDIIILNRLFDSYDETPPKHEDYFDKSHIEMKNTEKVLNELQNSVSSIEDQWCPVRFLHVL